MSIKRRHFISLTGAAAAVTSLAACAGGSTSSSGTSGGSGAGQDSDGTIRFWTNHPGGSKEIEEEIIARWNEANPDTPAELVTAGNNYEELAQRFNAALSGGDLPDVIILSDVTWFNFALNGQTEPLDELWKSENVDSGDFVDSLREDYNLEGKHFGMPYCRSTVLMYLNKEHLEAAGLPTDRGPETWAEFDEWAPRLMEVNGGVPALAFPNGSNYLDWLFQGMVWSFGGSFSEEWEPTFSKAETIEAATFLQEQVNKGHISIEEDPNNVFGLGNASTLVQSTGSLSGLTDAAEFEFITAFVPGPGPSSPTGGAGVAMPSGISDERKRNAMRFMDFLTSPDQNIPFTQGTGYMPVRKSALTDPRTEEYLQANPNARTAIDQLNENTKSQDAARVFVPGGGERIGAALDRIVLNGEDVATVFAALDEETSNVIERDIEPLL